MPWQTGKGLGNVPAPSGPSARYTLVAVLMVIGRGNRTVSRGGFSALPRTALDRRILFATWTWCLIVGHGIEFVEDDGLVFFSFGGGRGGEGVADVPRDVSSFSRFPFIVLRVVILRGWYFDAED